MLKAVYENPYRILGIFSNSSTKERLANHNKLKAFLKIGKTLNMPLDLGTLLPSLERTSEVVEEADSKLALPTDQLRHAQFWFIKCDSFDEIAFNHLLGGNMDMAVSIWSKKETFSSLQNRIVCALIKKDYGNAISHAETLYTSYLKDFVSKILGDVVTVDYSNIEHDFLNSLISEVGVTIILQFIHKPEWIAYVKKQNVGPVIQELSEALGIAKSSRGKGGAARYKAGVELTNKSKTFLPQLKDLVGSNNVQYIMIADKVGLEILQCGIDYFKASEPSTAARKALVLLIYASSVVKGEMAIERCKENIDVLKDIIEDLPPEEIVNEVNIINKELDSYSKKSDTIDLAIALLNNVRPYIESIRRKLGATNEYYLKISTQVVNNALYNIIQEVNSVQKDVKDVSGYIRLRTAHEKAWKATLMMESFDMESKFRSERFNENKKILKGLCEQLHIPTDPAVEKDPPKRPQSPNKPKPVTPKKPDSPKKPNDRGCITSLIFFLIIVIFFLYKGLSNQEKSQIVTKEKVVDEEYVIEDTAVCDTVVKDDSYTYITKANEYDEDMEYIDNRLSTGSKPYSYMGRAKTGDNYMSFETSGSHDFVVIVRDATNDKYMNHVYIRGGSNAKLYLPDGIFNVYFYSGKGWNPNKIKGNFRGAFVKSESLQKDEAISLYSAYIEYTLYPVQNGNLHLDSADDEEAFK